jgi:thiamine pyrophosphate-dependent acetolactate synthase large subunit-like protein
MATDRVHVSGVPAAFQRQAAGAAGITVRRADDLDGSLAAALRATGPAVVNVHIDPQAGAPTAGRNAGLLRDSAVGGNPVDLG